MRPWTALLCAALVGATSIASTQQPASPPARPSPGPAPQGPALDFKELAADTTVTLPSGATFTISKGWHVSQRDGLVVVEEPQRELAAAFLEVASKSPDDAIALGWKRWKPDFARSVRITARPPATQGWDEIAQTTYETGAEERRVVVAIARRKGDTYYLTLIDGALAAIERRSAQLNTAINGLKVPGRVEEDLGRRKAHPLDATRAAAFMAFVEEARKLTGVPGAAVAVIQDGRVVLEQGVGVLELGKPDPVTPDALFMIGSMTKPLTSLLMARLVDRGTFAWDTPVTKLLPAFALGDPATTARVTMAHTVCACTGLPRWDMEFIYEFEHATAESRVELLRAMKPTTGFGETFQYSNLMVASGGYAAAFAATRNADLRRAYVEAMQSEVLRPIGMSSTALALADAGRRLHARPHGRSLRFDPERIPTSIERGVDSVMPAGGAWSNVRDISRWLLLELGKGTLDGQRIVSEANLMARRKPQVQVSAKQSYGLALFIDESRGLTSIGHGGNTFGFTADASFLPDQGIGLVVLTNAAASNAFTGAVRRRLVELLLDGNEEAQTQLAYGVKQLGEQIEKRMKEIALNPDPEFVEPLLGTWMNPRLGTIEVRRDGTGFVLDAGEWTVPIGEHRDQSGARRLIATGPPFAGMTYWPQQHEGRPALLFETAQQKYWFERPAGTLQ